MGLRVTSEQLRDILSVARKLRACAHSENDEDYADLFLRAALALEHRARQLAFHPFDPHPFGAHDEEIRAVPHKPVNIVC